MKAGPDNSHIDIFLRIRPVPKQSACLQLEPSDGKVAFNLPRTYAEGYIKALQMLNALPQT